MIGTEEQLTKGIIEKIRKMVLYKVPLNEILQYLKSINLDENAILNVLYLIDFTQKQEQIKMLNQQLQNTQTQLESQQIDPLVQNDHQTLDQNQDNLNPQTSEFKTILKTSSLQSKIVAYDHNTHNFSKIDRNKLLNSIENNNQTDSNQKQSQQVEIQQQENDNNSQDTKIQFPNNIMPNNDFTIQEVNQHILNPNESIITQMQRQYLKSIIENMQAQIQLQNLHIQLNLELKKLKEQYQLKKDQYINKHKKNLQNAQSLIRDQNMPKQSSNNNKYLQSSTQEVEMGKLKYQFDFTTQLDLNELLDKWEENQSEIADQTTKKEDNNIQHDKLTVSDLTTNKPKQQTKNKSKEANNVKQTKSRTQTSENDKIEQKSSEKIIQDQSLPYIKKQVHNDIQNTTIDKDLTFQPTTQLPSFLQHNIDQDVQFSDPQLKEKLNLQKESPSNNISIDELSTQNNIEVSRAIQLQIQDNYDDFTFYIQTQFNNIKLPLFHNFRRKHIELLKDDSSIQQQIDSLNKKTSSFTGKIDKQNTISNIKTHLLFQIWSKQSPRAPDLAYSIYQLIKNCIYMSETEIINIMQLSKNKSIKQFCDAIVDYCTHKSMIQSLSIINKYFEYAEIVLVFGKQFQLHYITSEHWKKIFQNATNQILQILSYKSIIVVFDMTEFLNYDPIYQRGVFNQLTEKTRDVDLNMKGIIKQQGAHFTTENKIISIQSQKQFSPQKQQTYNQVNNQPVSNQLSNQKYNTLSPKKYNQNNNLSNTHNYQQVNNQQIGSNNVNFTQITQQYNDQSQYNNETLMEDQNQTFNSSIRANTNNSKNDLKISQYLHEEQNYDQIFNKLQQDKIYGVAINSELSPLAEIQKYKLCYLNFINDNTTRIKIRLEHPKYLITLTICQVVILNFQDCTNLQNFYTEQNSYSEELISNITNLRRFYSVRDSYKGDVCMLRQLMKQNYLEYINVVNGTNIVDAETYSQNIKYLHFFNIFGKRINMCFKIDITQEYPENLKILRYYLPQQQEYINPQVIGTIDQVKRLQYQLIK